ncbi:hypothetical protein [Xenorhabdus bovienii]|uniref:hypothetical protein n=1 Tax=Xenorhabdus bovienii TaxID=40576 RepID=UPI0023B2451B|nr:hypothetical protein [Xenorhabdus bovienii]MDE9537412.1 hypothetical protein [Xenorhabdus bovienii]MDE9590819.1 hypothetical protein [Xenorhabdus bovienii]
MEQGLIEVSRKEFNRVIMRIDFLPDDVRIENKSYKKFMNKNNGELIGIKKYCIEDNEDLFYLSEKYLVNIKH